MSGNPRPIRQPLTIYDRDHVRFCAPYGNNANDGYDGWRYPKETFLAAYDSLPSTGGVIYVMDGTYVGGEVHGQGVWLTGGTLYPGWRKTKKVAVYGFGGSVGQFSFPTARILAGQPGVSGRPNQRFDVGLWITENNDDTMLWNNVSFKEYDISLRLAVNGNPALDPDAPAQRGSAQTTALINFNQCAFISPDSYSGRDGGPGCDIGYVIWIFFNQCVSNVNREQDRLSDRRAAWLVKPGDGTSQLYWNQVRSAQGGIKYYNGASTWSFAAEDLLMEGDGNPLPPAVWLIGINTFGQGYIRSCFGADGPGGSADIVIDSPGPHFDPGQLIIENQPSPPQGSASTSLNYAPCTISGIDASNTVPIVSSAAARFQQGYWAGKLWADSDIARNSSPVITNRVNNLVPQHDGAGGTVGPVINPPAIEHSSDRVWTQQNVDATGGGTCVDSPVGDQLGSTNAIQISTNSGSQAYQRLWYAGRFVSAGDYFVGGAWVRYPAGVGALPLSVNITTYSGTITFQNHGDEVKPAFAGDGNWFFISGWTKVLTATPGAIALVNYVAFADPSHPLIIDRHFLYHIPASQMTENEVSALIQNLPGSFVQGPLGFATTQPEQGLIIQGAFASGDLRTPVSLAATVAHMPVYDAQGDLVGMVEVKPVA
jgi:hypothetical protein